MNNQVHFEEDQILEYLEDLEEYQIIPEQHQLFVNLIMELQNMHQNMNQNQQNVIPVNFVNEEDLAPNFIDEDEIPDNFVNEEDLAPNFIDEDEIPDNFVNEDEIPVNFQNQQNNEENFNINLNFVNA